MRPECSRFLRCIPPEVHARSCQFIAHMRQRASSRLAPAVPGSDTRPGVAILGRSTALSSRIPERPSWRKSQKIGCRAQDGRGQIVVVSDGNRDAERCSAAAVGTDRRDLTKRRWYEDVLNAYPV